MIDLNSEVVRACDHFGRKTIGERLGVDGSTISRYLSGDIKLDLADFCRLIRACEINVIPPGYELISSEERRAFAALAEMWSRSRNHA